MMIYFVIVGDPKLAEFGPIEEADANEIKLSAQFPWGETKSLIMIKHTISSVAGRTSILFLMKNSLIGFSLVLQRNTLKQLHLGTRISSFQITLTL
ncbi:hypothetical protein D3C73_1350720 [compost metagenome]